MDIKFKDISNSLSKTTTKSVSRKSLSSLPSSIPSSIPSSVPSFKSDLYNKKRPLKTNSSNLSFEGLFFKPILNDEKLVKFFDVTEVKHLSREYLDTTSERIFEHFMPVKDAAGNETNQVLKRAAKLVHFHDDGTVSFSKKTIPHLIYDGIAYPFKILPADMLNGLVGGLKKIKPLEGWATKVYDSQMFKNIRLRSKLDSQVNSFRGIVETADSLLGKPKQQKFSTYFQNSVKPFDSKSGNYDTKHERSLTRIVSGFIPATFLANDAYNLSRMCDDDPSAAKKEKKTRFKQETGRIVVQAYLTLITMGAIQKYINNSKLAVMANVGLTALFTEAVSRLVAGKQITKLTPEKARKLNAKQQGKSLDQIESEKIENKYKNVFFKSMDKKGSKAFFKGLDTSLSSETISSIQAGVPLKGNADPKASKEKQKAPLLSFNTLFKAIGATIVAGFAIKGLRQNKMVDSLIKKSLEPFNNVYKKLTGTENHLVKKTDFDNVLKILTENGFEDFAKRYVSVADRIKPIAIKNGIEKALTVKPSQIEKDIKALEELGGKAKKNALAQLLKDSDVAITEMSQTSEHLKAKGFEEIASKYDGLIKSIKEYSNSSLGQEAKAMNAELLKKASEKTKAKILASQETAELAKKLEAVLVENANYINVGKKEYKYAKPAVDFIVGPFKFVWNILEGPYFWANKAIEGLTKIGAEKVAKPPLDIEALAKADIPAFGKSFEFIEKAATRKNFKPQVFKDFINDNIAKSFNIDTMSSVSNSDLANLSKTAVLSATLPFLMLDNYNMVMLKSNGKDKDGAELKSKERLVQEGSRFFYQTLLISLFNSTFRTQYNGSLAGASWVTGTCTLIGEWLTRKSVGVPIGHHSRDEIIEMDKKRENANKVAKGYYDFMARLTGKKSLSEMHQVSQEKKTVKA